jgi:hypothetical protein
MRRATSRSQDRKGFAAGTRLRLLEADADIAEDRINDQEARHEALERLVTTLATRVGIYAAIGSLIGGALVAGVAAAFAKNLFA